MNQVISKRRRVPRRAYHHKVGVLFQGDYFIAQALEIGERGIMFQTDQVLSKDDLVVVSFYIPGYKHSIARGVVRYQNDVDGEDMQYRYGIEFQTIDFDSKRYVRYYVASDRSNEVKKNPAGKWAG